jgi:hypothetical protein
MEAVFFDLCCAGILKTQLPRDMLFMFQTRYLWVWLDDIRYGKLPAEDQFMFHVELLFE